jgi:hypothetical protein
VSIENSQIYNNAVGGDGKGGAGYLTNNSTVTLVGTSILNNSSQNGGAGFYLQGFNTLSLSYCTMAGNDNLGWGSGGVSAGDPCEIDISNSVVTGNSTDSPLGNDLPNNVTVAIEGSVVGDELIISNNDSADCRPNCTYVIPNADSIIEKDENGNVVIGDNGQVTIHLPDTVKTPDGGNVSITEIPEVPIQIDTATGRPTIPIGQDGNKPVELRLSLADSLVCMGQVATFRVRTSNLSGSAEYRLLRILQDGSTVQVGVKTNTAGSTTFAMTMQTPTVEWYRVEVYKGESLKATSNDVRLIIIPLATSGKIDHSKNVEN